MHKTYLKTAFILGAITVVSGAFGAHKLKEMVSDDAIDVYKTAVLYQFIHVFALALAGILFRDFANQFIKNAGIFFLLGILLFSGSLYLITYSKAIGSDAFKWVGPITPVGGVMFITGWVYLALGIRSKRSAQ